MDKEWELIDFSTNHNVKGDGNCLFRSLSVLADCHEDSWRDIKNNILQYITNNIEIYIEALPIEEVQSFLEHFQDDNRWGGEEEIVAFSDMYQTAVVIKEDSEDGKTLITIKPRGLEDIEPQRVCTLIWRNKSHYDPVYCPTVIL